MKAIVFGATGAVGKKLLKLLDGDSAISEVHAYVRKNLDSYGKIKYKQLDFQNLDDTKFKIETDLCFCSLGTTIKKAGSKDAFYKVDHDLPVAIAKCLQRSSPNASYVLVSAMGANSGSSVFYNKVKGEMEESIKELKHSKTIICRPSLIVSKRQEFRLAEELGIFAAKILRPLFVGPIKKYRAIEDLTIAAAMIQEAKHSLDKKPKTLNSLELELSAKSYFDSLAI